MLAPLNVDMLSGILYDSVDEPYDELVNRVFSKSMLVTCCIDAHFTAVQVIRSVGSASQPPASLAGAARSEASLRGALPLVPSQLGVSKERGVLRPDVPVTWVV